MSGTCSNNCYTISGCHLLIRGCLCRFMCLGRLRAVEEAVKYGVSTLSNKSHWGGIDASSEICKA